MNVENIGDGAEGGHDEDELIHFNCGGIQQDIEGDVTAEEVVEGEAVLSAASHGGEGTHPEQVDGRTGVEDEDQVVGSVEGTNSESDNEDLAVEDI